MKYFILELNSNGNEKVQIEQVDIWYALVVYHIFMVQSLYVRLFLVFLER